LKKLELDITFTRDYFTKNFGIIFKDIYFYDVNYRVEMDQKIKTLLFKKWGNYGLGEENPYPIYQIGFDDTLNIILNFGGEVIIREGVSWVKPGFLAKPENIKKIEVPNIPYNYPNTFFLEKYDEAVSLYGKDSIKPPTPHGILECAIEMCGSAFFEYLLLYPSEAEYLLDILTETIIKMKEYWDKKCYGEVRPGIGLGSCSTTVLSPMQVSKFLVPRYRKIASKFGNGFLCSCGVSTHNLENFADISEAYYVRIGWGTDIVKAAALLKDRHLKTSLDVNRAAGLSVDEFEKDIICVLNSIKELENASILLIHASADTPDANIKCLVEIVRNWTNEHYYRA